MTNCDGIADIASDSMPSALSGRVSEESRQAARVLWDYHQLDHQLVKSDCILVLGSNDVRVAHHAARVFVEGWAPEIVFSGGVAHQNDLLATSWECSEAEHFAAEAEKLGVPRSKMRIENQATNTGENISFCKRLLESCGLSPRTFIIVQKPFMQRRVYATFRVHFPSNPVAISSPCCGYEDYVGDHCSEELLINLMVGDLQRIARYADKGFQIAQVVPKPTWEAYHFLVAGGFTKHLMAE
jgi:uncharacterized SAM-binding protein YcdF (DUF218 family)